MTSSKLTMHQPALEKARQAISTRMSKKYVAHQIFCLLSVGMKISMVAIYQPALGEGQKSYSHVAYQIFWLFSFGIRISKLYGVDTQWKIKSVMEEAT